MITTPGTIGQRVVLQRKNAASNPQARQSMERVAQGSFIKLFEHVRGLIEAATRVELADLFGVGTEAEQLSDEILQEFNDRINEIALRVVQEGGGQSVQVEYGTYARQIVDDVREKYDTDGSTVDAA